MKWFFEDLEAVDRLRREAKEWLFPPTPFRKFSRAKGRGGGVDCVGLAEALMIAAGVLKENEFIFPRSDADYSSAATVPKVLRYLRGHEWRDSQSAKLARIFAEIPMGFKTTVNPPAALFVPGDLLILRNGGVFHVPVIIEGRHFVNAIPEVGVREGNIHDPTFSQYLIALFRAKAR